MNEFISKRLWILENSVSNEVKEAFVLKLFDERRCKPICGYFHDRPSSGCESCDAYKGTVSLFKQQTIKGKSYLGFPGNNPQSIKKVFGFDYWKLPNLRKKIPFSKPIKFIGKLRDGNIDGTEYQQTKICNDWLQKKLGIIEAPARSGKTVISTYCSVKLGLRTIVIADRMELLQQFEKAWLNTTDISKDKIKIVTNIKDLMNSDKYDVLLLNYQKLMQVDGKVIKRKGWKRIAKYINNKYTLAIVDECHGTGALSYYGVIMELKCRYMMGLTATPDRKDSMTTLIKQCLGPVVCVGLMTSTPPLIIPIPTGFISKARGFTTLVKSAYNSKKRQDLIIQHIISDLQKGNRILIPMTMVKPMPDFKDRIDKALEKHYKETKEDFGESIVGIISGNSDRKTILEKFEQGIYKVLIASSTIIKQGIDFKHKDISVLYSIFPMSASGQTAIGAPMMYQTFYRICSPIPGKSQPTIKWFLDSTRACISCYRSAFWKEIYPRLKEYNERPTRYKMSDKHIAFMRDFVCNRSKSDDTGMLGLI